MNVYAIKNPDTGDIKIGISKDPEARLKQLRVGNNADLRLVLVKRIEAPNRFQDERFAHLKNQYLRIRGEWFRSGVRLLTKIKKPVCTHVADAESVDMTRLSARYFEG